MDDYTLLDSCTFCDMALWGSGALKWLQDFHEGPWLAADTASGDIIHINQYAYMPLSNGSRLLGAYNPRTEVGML